MREQEDENKGCEMNQLSQRIDELRMLFDRLAGREKVLVLATIGGFLAFIVVIIGIGVNISLAGLKDRLKTQKTNYEQIVALKERFSGAQADIERFKKQIKGRKDNLTGDFGNMAQEAGIEISQVTESKGAVDKKAKIREKSYKIELKRVELAPLLQLLERIEQKDEFYFVRSVRMKRRFDDKALLDVTFRLGTLLPLEEEG